MNYFFVFVFIFFKIIVYFSVQHIFLGAMMVRNIKMRGCPLKSIVDFPTAKSLQARYMKLGYRHVHVRDMNDVYYTYLNAQDRQRAEKLELFDELEEWHLIQGHYCLTMAVNDDEEEVVEEEVEEVSLKERDRITKLRTLLSSFLGE